MAKMPRLAAVSTHATVMQVAFIQGISLIGRELRLSRLRRFGLHVSGDRTGGAVDSPRRVSVAGRCVRPTLMPYRTSGKR